jgi:hypothetical protein
VSTLDGKVLDNPGSLALNWFINSSPLLLADVSLCFLSIKKVKVT